MAWRQASIASFVRLCLFNTTPRLVHARASSGVRLNASRHVFSASIHCSSRSRCCAVSYRARTLCSFWSSPAVWPWLPAATKRPTHKALKKLIKLTDVLSLIWSQMVNGKWQMANDKWKMLLMRDGEKQNETRLTTNLERRRSHVQPRRHLAHFIHNLVY